MQPPSVSSLHPLQALLFSLPGPAREARPPWDRENTPPRGSRLGVPSSARPNQAVRTARSNAGPRSAVLAPPCFCYNFMHTIYYFSEALTDGFLFVWINFRLLFLPCNLFPLSCCFSSSSCLFCFLLCILKTFLKCFMILGCPLIFRSEAIKKLIGKIVCRLGREGFPGGSDREESACSAGFSAKDLNVGLTHLISLREPWGKYLWDFSVGRDRVCR